jgi:hypothetical protein
MVRPPAMAGAPVVEGSLTGLSLCSMNAPESELKQAIFRDKVAHARLVDPGIKLVAGARLFDVARERMLAGIQSRHPEWQPAVVAAECDRQLKLLRQREERGIFALVDSL